MQAASDIMLGWLHTSTGLDGKPRDFYVRQLWDWKFSPRLDIASAQLLRPYAQLCAWTLARAHARSGDRVAIAAYLGRGDRFDKAIAQFAEAYADQSERDYEALVTAVKRGRIAAVTGL
jgi:predicted alpha/beta hydrolase